MDKKCDWIDEHYKCWYWMPDSKMTCDYINNQEDCKEFNKSCGTMSYYDSVKENND